MSNQNMAQMDPVDDLLANAFDQALSGPGNTDLIDQVMDRIAHQQRRRALVLTVSGLAAFLVCMVSAMPLLELLPALMAEFFSEVPRESWLGLPVTLTGVAIAIAGSWLLIEEVTG